MQTIVVLSIEDKILPDAQEYVRAIRMSEREFDALSSEIKLATASKDSRAHADELKRSLVPIRRGIDDLKARLESLRSYIAANRARITTTTYKVRQMCTNDEVRAGTEATNIVNGLRFVDQVVFEREIVESCTEDLPVTGGDLSPFVRQRLFGAIRGMSTVSEDEILFFELSPQTSDLE